MVTFGTLTGGSGYVPGTYTSVRLTGGTGIDCYVDITVNGSGVVSNVVLHGAIWGGSGYTVGNSLTVANTYLGGSGSGFAITVASINTTATGVQNAVNNGINVTYKNYYQSQYVAGVSGNQYTGGATPYDGGANNQLATYQIRGATYNLEIADCTFSVPAGAPACNFIPVVVNLQRDFTPGTIASGSTAINSVTLTNTGSGYVNGTCTSVPLTGGSGTQATATIVVSGNAVSAVTLQLTGSGYAVNNTLSASNANLGGSGSGLVLTVATIGSTLYNTSTQCLPTNCRFTNILFDGYFMGWVGSSLNCEWIDCTSIRYSDFQNSVANDPLGNMIGLVGYWTAPPHWFYFANDNVFNSNCIIKQSYDAGEYVGSSVHRSSSSGIITSMKLGPQYGSVVDGFDCFRAEGILQVTTAGNPNGRLENLYAIANTTSTFIVKPGDSAVGAYAMVFPANEALFDVFIAGKFEDSAPVPCNFIVGSDSTSAHSNTEVNFNCLVQDYPATAFSYVNTAGITVTSGYNTGYPGIGFAGTGNKVTVTVKFANFTNVTQTFRGVIANQGSTVSNQTLWNVEIIGWRTLVGPTIDYYKSRIIIAGSGAANNTNIVNQTDVNNQLVPQVRGAKMAETWVQDGVFPPTAGASYATSMVFPNTFSVTDAVYENGSTPPAGPTTYSLGDSASATRILASMATNATNNPFLPRVSPIALVNSPTTVLLTANGSNFTGTGTIYIAVEGQRSSVSG